MMEKNDHDADMQSAFECVENEGSEQNCSPGHEGVEYGVIEGNCSSGQNSGIDAMEKKTFAVVEFADDNSIEIVPTTWLEEATELNYLRSLGGADEGAAVRKMMRKVASTEVLSAYSLKGRKGKLAFQSLRICNIIVRKKWKYSAVLSFLDRFVSPRETSGNMERGDEENQAAGYDQPEDQGEAAAAVEPTGSFDGSEPGSPLSETAAASPVASSTSAAVPRAPRRRARPREQPSEVERQLLEALRTRPVAPAPPPRSVDEHFLLSLVPSLERLPPQTKEYVKFQMHKLIYESSTVMLNLEQLEPIE
ncbi:hypothetical protein E1301_Tti019069 [Triplophysa tibetana]|uniref:BESS domain-containing protein n=1 Tax=Triplophysa tibetana TaxID=1572043 RepID=A0A5A9NTX2_9TELE|nr:hypothetical protein E1301_Tti019069 [Triplophysa tibetana]